MPKIQTYSSQVSPNYKLSSASDFVDTTGLQDMAKALQSTYETWQKSKDEEKQIAMAKAVSDGRQKWMFDIESRRQQVEDGTLSYSGLTQAVQTDFKKWSDEIVSKFDGADAERMGISLNDMGTQVFNDAMRIEATYRSKAMVDNYNGIYNNINKNLSTADSQPKVLAASIAAEQDVNNLPPELGKQLKNNIEQSVTENLIRVSKTRDELDATKSRIDNLADKTTPSQFQSLLGSFDRQRNYIDVKTLTEAEDFLKKSSAIAQMGDLESGWQIPALNAIRPLLGDNPKADELQKAISEIDQVNSINREIWNNPKDDVSAKVISLQDQYNKETNIEKKTTLGNTLQTYYDQIANRNKMLETDTSTAVMSKDPEAKNDFDAYKQFIQNKDIDNAKNAFLNYSVRVKAMTDKIGYTGPTALLPSNEIDTIISSIDKALSTPNGLLQVTDTLNTLAETTGSDYASILDQITSKDKTLSGLNIMHRVAVASGKSPLPFQNELLAAIALKRQDPEGFAKSIVINDSNRSYYKSMIDMNASLNQASLYKSASDRKNAFTNLFGLYKKRGVDEDDAAKQAYDRAYGDIGVTSDGIVYPKEIGAARVTNSIAYAKTELKFLDRKLLQAPMHANDQEKTKMMDDPNLYIDFVTSQDGNGLMAVWKTPNGSILNEPVMYNGKPIIKGWQ